MTPALAPAVTVSEAAHNGTAVKYDKHTLADLLKRAWGPFTSAYNTCASPNLAWGQSDVTALVVQEALGGEIFRVTFETSCGKKGAHFLNLLPDGERMDVALSGYPQGTVFVPPLDAPDAALRASTMDYLKQHQAGNSLSDHLLTLLDNEVNADSKKLRGILSEQPPSERRVILQHNIECAKAGRIARA